MFPRFAKSEKKSGVYEYLVISESVHIKGKGSTTHNIANLGNIKKFGYIRISQEEKFKQIIEIYNS